MKLNIYDYKELNFVELNYTGGNETYIRCDKESKYLDTTVFNIFAPCFEAANKLYEYYGPTKYNARKIIPLRNELINHLDSLKVLSSPNDFADHLSLHYLGSEFLDALEKEDPNWKDSWKDIQNKLISLSQEMIDLTEKCADEEKILWVVGY